MIAANGPPVADAPSRDAAWAEIAAELSLGEALQLGSGELKSGGFRRQSILADALEALIGAIYLDGGLAAAEAPVQRLFGARLAALPPPETLKARMASLIELANKGLERPDKKDQLAWRIHHESAGCMP